MTAVDRPTRRLSGPLAVLTATILGLGVLAGCTDSSESAPSERGSSESTGTHHSGGSGGGGHHEPAQPTGHFDPNKCPTGLVC